MLWELPGMTTTMPDRRLLLRAPEVRRLLDTGTLLVVRPVVPPPLAGAETKESRVPPAGFRIDSRFWVAETWQLWHSDQGLSDGSWVTEADVWLGAIPDGAGRGPLRSPFSVAYLADSGGDEGPWRSAATMPRWASRLTVRVESVEARRVWEITGAAVQATGGLEDGPSISSNPHDLIRAFAREWDAHYAKKTPWSADPWCWLVNVTKEVRDAV